MPSTIHSGLCPVLQAEPVTDAGTTTLVSSSPQTATTRVGPPLPLSVLMGKTYAMALLGGSSHVLLSSPDRTSCCCRISHGPEDACFGRSQCSGCRQPVLLFFVRRSATEPLPLQILESGTGKYRFRCFPSKRLDRRSGLPNPSTWRPQLRPEYVRAASPNPEGLPMLGWRLDSPRTPCTGCPPWQPGRRTCPVESAPVPTCKREVQPQYVDRVPINTFMLPDFVDFAQKTRASYNLPRPFDHTCIVCTHLWTFILNCMALNCRLLTLAFWHHTRCTRCRVIICVLISYLLHVVLLCK